MNPERKPLLLQGPRQVGKTYAVRQLGRSYISFIEVNFLQRPELISIFKNAHDPKRIRQELVTLIPDASFIDHQTLLLLDEAQECPECITALKFWAEEGLIDVICSGSALGLCYRLVSSFPVGYVDFMHLDSLDYEEFLWASGTQESSVDLIREALHTMMPFSLPVHERFRQLQSEYLITGGMPEAVLDWVQNHSIDSLHEIQRKLYEGYMADIAKFASSDERIKARACYQSIPQQLLKPNHKFQYSVVQSKGNAQKYRSSLDWLEQAMMIRPVNNVKAVQFPLQFLQDPSDFRIYPTDIGMLMAALPKTVKNTLLTESSVPASLDLGTFKGPLFEALAFDVLMKARAETICFYKPKKREAEIEFLLENNGQIYALEVKAGRNKSKSLDTILTENPSLIGIKAGNYQFGKKGHKFTIPLYALPFILSALPAGTELDENV